MEHNDAGCISRVPIFKTLSLEEMLEVADLIEPLYIDKDEMLISEGDPLGKLYILHTGRIKIYRITSGGKEQILRIVEPGDFIGETSLFSDTPSLDFAKAMLDSRMCVIDGRKLNDLMIKYPQITFKILNEMSRRLTKAETLIESISNDSVEKRIASAILDLSDGKDSVTLNMSKGEFASSLGMSQETLSRKLASLQGEGMIILEGQKKIRITDRDGLEETAEI